MFKPIVPLAILSTAIALSSPLSSHADTLLVGTQLNPVPAGSEICDECEPALREFSSPVPFDIDEINVAVLGPFTTTLYPNTSFNAYIFTSPANPDTPSVFVGTGEVTFNSTGQSLNTYIVGFSNLNIPIQPNVDYYLELSGGDLLWAGGESQLSNELGSIGPGYTCDPAFTCENPSLWDPAGADGMQIYGNQISGNVTPEPAGWLLLGTGVFAIWSLRRKLRRP